MKQTLSSENDFIEMNITLVDEGSNHQIDYFSSSPTVTCSCNITGQLSHQDDTFCKEHGIIIQHVQITNQSCTWDVIFHEFDYFDDEEEEGEEEEDDNNEEEGEEEEDDNNEEHIEDAFYFEIDFDSYSPFNSFPSSGDLRRTKSKYHTRCCHSHKTVDDNNINSGSDKQMNVCVGLNGKAMKKVHFPVDQNLVTIHHLIAWSYAYKVYRKSECHRTSTIPISINDIQALAKKGKSNNL